MHHVTGMILAGGRNSRMGRDKALLPLPGQKSVTFVEHLVSLLSAQCCEVLLVARDEFSAANYTHIQGMRILTDQIPDYGPLMGLYSGLKTLQLTSHALVVAVDMPLVQPELISFLLNQPTTENLLVPLVNAVPQVLLAVYPRSVLPLIEACLQQGRRDPRSLLAIAPVRYIDETQLRLVDPLLRSFRNVNTPEDLKEIS